MRFKVIYNFIRKHVSLKKLCTILLNKLILIFRNKLWPQRVSAHPSNAPQVPLQASYATEPTALFLPQLLCYQISKSIELFQPTIKRVCCHPILQHIRIVK